MVAEKTVFEASILFRLRAVIWLLALKLSVIKLQVVFTDSINTSFANRIIFSPFLMASIVCSFVYV
jgi:hypothetical protein